MCPWYSFFSNKPKRVLSNDDKVNALIERDLIRRFDQQVGSTHWVISLEAAVYMTFVYRFRQATTIKSKQNLLEALQLTLMYLENDLHKAELTNLAAGKKFQIMFYDFAKGGATIEKHCSSLNVSELFPSIITKGYYLDKQRRANSVQFGPHVYQPLLRLTEQTLKHIKDIVNPPEKKSFLARVKAFFRR